MNRIIGGRNRTVWILVLVVLGAVLAGATATADTILYVDSSAAPGGDGSTWANAYESLQDALIAAQTPSLTSTVQIRVAAGTYTPGDTQDDSFLLHDHVELYGGFPVDSHASNPGWSARDPRVNETTLSGDIGTQGVSTDNSFHVVTSDSNDSSAVLDGFTITGGYDDSDNGTGGGMVNSTSSPTVTNCIFSDNTALKYGGGMHNNASSPIVSDCVFTDNHVAFSMSGTAYGYGGGMYNDGGSSPQVTNCTFSGNQANVNGGGMYNTNGSSPQVRSCTFSDNKAGFSGGGMYNDGGSTPTVTDCTFTENSSDGATDCGGGGMYYSMNGSPPAVTGCTFSRNEAADSGAGLCLGGTGGSLALIDCTFNGNSATYDGGGLCTRSVGLALEDCAVVGNSADLGGGICARTCNLELTNVILSGNLSKGNAVNNGLGGGIYNTDSSSYAQILTNVTFSGNRATGNGGALYNASSNPDIRNCIFWNNEDSSGIGTLTASVSNDTSTPTFSNSLVQGATNADGTSWNSAAGASSGSNFSRDPKFVALVNPADAPTTAGNLRLQSDSPAIDAGDNSVVTATTDLDGTARIVDGTLDGTATVDLGAYEYTPHGDVNGDGVINVLDVRLCLQIAQGVIPGTAAERHQADLNDDGQVTVADAQLLAQVVMMH